MCSLGRQVVVCISEQSGGREANALGSMCSQSTQGRKPIDSLIPLSHKRSVLLLSSEEPRSSSPWARDYLPHAVAT